MLSKPKTPQGFRFSSSKKSRVGKSSQLDERFIVFNRLLRNREFRVKVVKTPRDEFVEEMFSQDDSDPIDIKLINEVAKDFVTHSAIAVGAVIVTYYISTAITETFVALVKAKLRG